jgi:hypothetical protein
MSDRPITTTEELVTDYLRSTMRVDAPHDLTNEIMRAVAAAPQDRKSILGAFGILTPAFAAIVVTAVLVVAAVLALAPRNVGPAPDAVATPTPVPSITPEEARILTDEDDVIRIPALDGEGPFGTITIERGADKAGYAGFVPIAFQDVFFIELYVTYEPTRATAEQFGEWEFAIAADLDDDGFDSDDVLQRGVGFSGMEDMPGFDSAPRPLLQGKRFGEELLEGWLVLEVPAAAAGSDIYLVYGHNEWTDGIENLAPDFSALLRLEGDPVGVTAFDPDAFPTPEGTPPPMPTLIKLPSPAPSPIGAFEPGADADADALFAETQSCTNGAAEIVVTFPASWHTNEATAEFPACSFFDEAPIDVELALSGLGPHPLVIRWLPSWGGGIEEPITERFELDARTMWRISWTAEQQSFGLNYLIELTDDPYGPFIHAAALEDEDRAVLDRMITRLEFTD